MNKEEGTSAATLTLVCASPRAGMRQYFYVPKDLGMDIYVCIYPYVYLDGDVAVSLDRSRGNEPKKLRMKGYSRDMKTWRLWKRRNIHGRRERDVGNEKSDRIEGRKKRTKVKDSREISLYEVCASHSSSCAAKREYLNSAFDLKKIKFYTQ